MSLYVKRYGDVDLDIDIKYCRILLKRLESFISDIKLSVYKNYPNVSQGKLIKEVADPLNKDFAIKDLIPNQDIFTYIFEFKFKLKVKDYIFDAYLRRNNYNLSKVYGQFELDIFGNSSISNFGDLIIVGNDEFKKIVEVWIKNDAKQLRIPIREAYISSSEGDAEIDISKRVWLYYASPVDFLRDIIKFIKNFTEIDAPKYVKEEYEKFNDKLKPYDDRYIASELYSSIKFKPKFEDFVKENKIAVATGSLMLSSNDLDSNFIFTREIAEKIIFPVMRNVPGRKDFIEIIKKEL